MHTVCETDGYSCHLTNSIWLERVKLILLLLFYDLGLKLLVGRAAESCSRIWLPPRNPTRAWINPTWHISIDMQFYWHVIDKRKSCWCRHKKNFRTCIDISFQLNGTSEIPEKQRNNIKLFKRYDYCSILPAIFYTMVEMCTVLPGL